MDVFGLSGLNHRITSLLSFAALPRTVVAVYLLLTLAVSIQSLVSVGFKGDPGEGQYTDYNNYVIFQQASVHLVEGQNLYGKYAEDYWDYYKYSPTFALGFWPLAQLPDALGLTLWNALNGAALLLGLWFLPWLSTGQKSLMAWLVLPEYITAAQSEQSNALMAGLILLAFAGLEHRRLWGAALLVVSTVFVKIFGLVAGALFLLYKPQWKTIAWAAVWTAVLAILPAVIVGWDGLAQQYAWWLELLAADTTGQLGTPHPLGLAALLESWFQWKPSNGVLVATGAALFLLPWVRWNRFFLYPYRLLALASVLLWVVLFNHKAESPTFIIAMVGVVVWYMARPELSWRKWLLGFAFVFTGLVSSDVFPLEWRKAFFEPYAIKVLPVALVWLAALWEMGFSPLRNAVESL
jgi:hypothetical protein